MKNEDVSADWSSKYLTMLDIEKYLKKQFGGFEDVYGIQPSREEIQVIHLGTLQHRLGENKDWCL